MGGNTQMILIDNHIEHDIYAKLDLSGEKKDSLSVKYRVLKIGEVTNYLSTEQAETLFDELDKQLHEVTYVELQDQVYSIQQDLDEANENIERLQDSLAENFA